MWGIKKLILCGHISGNYFQHIYVLGFHGSGSSSKKHTVLPVNMNHVTASTLSPLTGLQCIKYFLPFFFKLILFCFKYNWLSLNSEGIICPARNRILERTISLRFLGISSEFSDLRFLYRFLKLWRLLSGFRPRFWPLLSSIVSCFW